MLKNMKTYLLSFIILFQIINIQTNNAQCSYTAKPSCGSTVTSFATGQSLSSVVCYTPGTFTTSTIATCEIGSSGGAPGAGSLVVTNANLTITTLTLNASYAGALYIEAGATVTIGNAITMPAVANTRIVNRGTLTFSNTGGAVTIGQNATVQTAATTATTTFAKGFTTTSGTTAYFSKGTTISTGGTITCANNSICLDGGSYWNANAFSFSTGAGTAILSPSTSYAIINYNGAISNTGGGNICGSANLKMCTVTGGTACASITGKGSTTCVGSSCSNPLPVMFSNFYATPKPTGIDLYWSTSQEYNNDYFVVERSYDGKNFEAINKVTGQGTKSSETIYMTVDAEANLMKPIYYRLKQVDNDGALDYSPEIHVNNLSEEVYGISIYPNPVEQTGTTLYAKFGHVSEGENAEAILFTVAGKQVQSYTIEGVQSGGIYII
jgi:hypothetical protein